MNHGVELVSQTLHPPWGSSLKEGTPRDYSSKQLIRAKAAGGSELPGSLPEAQVVFCIQFMAGSRISKTSRRSGFPPYSLFSPETQEQ